MALGLICCRIEYLSTEGSTSLCKVERSNLHDCVRREAACGRLTNPEKATPQAREMCGRSVVATYEAPHMAEMATSSLNSVAPLDL